MNASKNNVSVNQKTLTRMNNRFLTTFFMGFKLPLALVAGLRVESVSIEQGRVSLPYGWRNQNPFRSIYFAAQSMAAEMSTGVLGQLACDSVEDSISMLVVKCEGEFYKKATDRTTFICIQGQDFFDAIQETIRTGEPVTVTAISEGKMPDGTITSRFIFTWSFKKRSQK